MNTKIAIIDYSLGNLFSVSKAFSYAGAEVVIAERAEDILSAKALVLPGVGAFKNGMQELEKRDLINAIRSHVLVMKKPILGICLGMQLLFDSSEEDGYEEGLGFIPGTIIQIPTMIEGKKLKVPHIGWSSLENDSDAAWNGTILETLPLNNSVYFLHSYYAACSLENIIAITTYQGLAIPAVVRQENIYGCQFHPEKSGEIGISIIRRFLAWVQEYA